MRRRTRTVLLKFHVFTYRVGTCTLSSLHAQCYVYLDVTPCFLFSSLCSSHRYSVHCFFTPALWPLSRSCPYLCFKEYTLGKTRPRNSNRHGCCCRRRITVTRSRLPACGFVIFLLPIIFFPNGRVAASFLSVLILFSVSIYCSSHSSCSSSRFVLLVLLVPCRKRLRCTIAFVLFLIDRTATRR